MKHSAFRIGILFLFGCAEPAPVTPAQPAVGKIALYHLGDGRQRIECFADPALVDCGSVPDPGPNTIIYDCSTSEISCVTNGTDVMAVPRGKGLEVGMTYEAWGATLTVERCFGSEGCPIAMIRSMCAGAVADGGGQQVVFYSTPDRGVIAFHALPNVPDANSSIVRDAIPILTYVLAAKKGFLAVPLVRPQQDLSGSCR